MHEVEVDVVEAHCLKGGIEGGLDSFRRVIVVPEFGSDEEFGAGDVGLLDCCFNRGLGSINSCCINMSEACLQCFGDGFFLVIFVLPGAETKRWNARPSVELQWCCGSHSSVN